MRKGAGDGDVGDAGMRVWPMPDAAQTFYFRDRGGGGVLIAGNLEGTGAVKRGEGQNERATVPTVVGQPWAVDVRQKHQTGGAMVECWLSVQCCESRLTPVISPHARERRFPEALAWEGVRGLLMRPK